MILKIFETNLLSCEMARYDKGTILAGRLISRQQFHEFWGFFWFFLIFWGPKS